MVGAFDWVKTASAKETTVFGQGNIVIEFHAERLSRALAESPRRLRQELAKVINTSLAAHENVIKRNRFQGYRGESYSNRLQRRSGALANAYRVYRTTESSLDGSAGIRSGVRGSEYAKMQEFGGTIRPKRGKDLTIPTTAALTPSGVLSGRYKIRKSGTGYTTDAGDTFLFKSRRGNLLIGIKKTKTKGFGAGVVQRAVASGRGKDRELTAFYVLRRQVRIPARFGFFAAWNTIEGSLMPKLMARAADRALAFQAAAKALGGGA